jgi:hypothetical protein
MRTVGTRKWARLPGKSFVANEANAPRFLTPEEITYVVNHLPPILACDTTAADVIWRGITDTLYTLCSNNMLCPDAVGDLAIELVERHNRSLVPTGTPVGSVATEAIGASTTQMTLNTFHYSGSSTSVTSGIEAIKDLIYAKRSRQNETCTVYFEDRTLTYEQVLNKRIGLVGTTVADFVEDFTLLPVDRETDTIENWYDSAMALSGITELPTEGLFMRLYFNVSLMYKHRVTMSRVIYAIRNISLDDDAPDEEASTDDPLDGIMVVAGPLRTGIIDIYASDRVSSGIPTRLPIELRDTTFLYNVVRPHLATLTIKGVKGISAITPIVYQVWRVVHTERRLEGADRVYLGLPDTLVLDRCWICHINVDLLRTTGVELANLTRIVQATTLSDRSNGGAELILQRPDLLVVRLPVSAQSSTPGEYINSLIKSDTDRTESSTADSTETYQRQRNATGNASSGPAQLFREPATELMAASEIVHLETAGSNLQLLLSQPDVDKRRTVCNNIHTAAAVLGIEAALSVFIRELTNIIRNNSSYVHPATIELLGEVIMSRGIPSGANFIGIARQRTGFLSLSTLERAAKVISDAALHKKHESAAGVSASIALGTRIAVGTGAIDVAMMYNDKLLVNTETLDPENIELAPARGYVDATGNAASSMGILDLTKGENDSNLMAGYNDGEKIMQVPLARARPRVLASPKVLAAISRLPVRRSDIISTGTTKTTGLDSSIQSIQTLPPLPSFLLDAIQTVPPALEPARRVGESNIPDRVFVPLVHTATE